MELSRNQEHFIIMTVIYNELTDFTFGEGKLVRSADDIIHSMCEQASPFVTDCIMISLQKYGEIKSAYIPYLNKWKWERLPLLTQAILLMSYTHYKFLGPVDKSIVINIAVTLAKKYIDDKQAKFINGLLDSGVLD